MTTVTGYKLRAAVKQLEMQLEAAVRTFNDSLVKFPSETKAAPVDAMGDFLSLEARIAKLQAAQAEYNTKVTVNVLGNDMTLAEAVKRVGGAGRAVAMWKKAAGATDPNSRYYRDTSPYENMRSRNKDEEYAQRTISDKDATLQAVASEAFASALRGAIAEGNSTSVDVSLDPALLA